MTGEPLIQRPDDNEAALKKRLATYHRETVPVVDYYRKKGIHTRIDADQSASTVWENIRTVFQKTGHFPTFEAGVKATKA